MAREEGLEKGTLYLVGVPIGNPEDLSPRAGRILASVDYIAAEDTRKAARLLSSLGIGNRLLSYFEHNQASRHPKLLADLEAGLSLALISDAGMPSISDPGQDLVRLALDRSIPVSVIPGPSASLTALAASGLDSSRFVFEGFLPVRGKERKGRLKAIRQEERTLIFYEAPHRLEETLLDLDREDLGDRKLLLARELTKKYEEYLYLTVKTALDHIRQVKAKGEFTLVLEGLAEYRARKGDPAPGLDDPGLEARLRVLLDQGTPVKEAARLLADQEGLSKRDLYQKALEIKREAGSG